MTVTNEPGIATEGRTDIAIIAPAEVGFVLATLNEAGPERGAHLGRTGNLLNAKVAKTSYDA